MRLEGKNPDMTIAPVLDTRELAQLGEELGDRDALCTFLDRYATMLDQRVDRLERALDARDVDDWEDAALSLRTSSQMAGAMALSRLVAEVQAWLKSVTPENPWPGESALHCVVMCLRLLAAETARQLRVFVGPSGA